MSGLYLNYKLASFALLLTANLVSTETSPTTRGNDDFGEACTNKNDCSTTNAICGDDGNGRKVCTCSSKEVYLEDTDSCLLRKFYGEVCSETKQCITSGAKCDMGRAGDLICQCPADAPTHASDDTCQPRKNFGEICTDDSQCNTTGSVCMKKPYMAETLCGCPDDIPVRSTMEDGSDSCVPINYGSSCSSDGDCNTLTAGCIYNHMDGYTCRCSSGYTFHETGNKCMTRNYNKDCNNGHECSTLNAVCVSRDDYHDETICKCKDEWFYYSDGDVCLQMKAHAENCTITEQCLTDGSVCGVYSGETVCHCPGDSLIYDPTEDACVKEKRYGESCTVTTDCQTANAICVESEKCGKTCGCDAEDRYLEDMDQCVKKAEYGMPCRDYTDCSTPLSVCQAEGTEKLCLCDQQHVYRVETNECLELKEFGDLCSTSDQCITEGAICAANLMDNAICTCTGVTPVYNDTADICEPRTYTTTATASTFASSKGHM